MMVTDLRPLVHYRKSCFVCACDLGPAKKRAGNPDAEVLCFECPYPEDDQQRIAKVLAKIGGQR